jgi:uncharacterized protein (DUF1501 family)
MERRKFIRNLTLGGAAGFALGGIPVSVLAGNRALKRLAAASGNENVLVFIQLHGGNDALNTLIPVSQYNEYYNLRSNIAIPDYGTRKFINVDTTIPEADQVGLHPDMLSFKEMYDDGIVSIVQNVGYPDMNLSHFRGRDIVFMGGDAYDDYQSGWMGRFLDNVYPGYPDAYPNQDMPDPLGVELSGTLSLAFHREMGIPIGLNLGSPDQFYQLISSVGVDPPITTPDSHAGDELEYIMEFEKKSNQYAERLKNVYDAGSNSTVEYPEEYPYATQGNYAKNPLSGQLRLIARMLKGGVKTRIFLCRIGGFDTHGEQTVEYDSTLGIHASLLYHLSTAIKAFFDDLNALGMDHKVMAMTFTEFGRRAYSNASYGTDHGTSTPVFLFGPVLNPGIYGTNPDLSDLHNGNLKYNIDYRNIYTSIVQDWFGADDQALIETGFSEWVDTKLPLVGTTGVNDLSDSGGRGINCRIYPNPVGDQLNVFYRLEKQGTVQFTVLDTSGRVLMSISQQGYLGDNQQSMNISELPEGLYHLRIVQGPVKTGSQFIKIR